MLVVVVVVVHYVGLLGLELMGLMMPNLAKDDCGLVMFKFS